MRDSRFIQANMSTAWSEASWTMAGTRPSALKATPASSASVKPMGVAVYSVVSTVLSVVPAVLVVRRLPVVLTSVLPGAWFGAAMGGGPGRRPSGWDCHR